MPRVLTCTDFNESTQQCVTEAWVEQVSPFIAALPTVEQANEVGAVIFTSLLFLALVKNLTKPPRETDT